MRWLIVISTLAFLLLATPVSAASDGFATPEDAVREYLAGVATADAERILAAAAVDEVAEGFRFDAFVERLGAFLPGQSLGPAEYPFYVEVNRAQQSAQLLHAVQLLAYSLLTTEALDTGAPIVPVDDEWAATFASQVDPAYLAGLEVVDVRFPNPDVEQDERYLEIAAEQATTYGADELTERLALVRLAGRPFGVGFTLGRFGDAWKVISQVSPLAGTSGLGTATPMTDEDVERFIAGES